MIRKRRICVVTGTRAEYGLLYWLMKEIDADKDLELQIIVTGMHVSPEFGLTYKIIENDGFVISRKIDMLLSSDTPVGISKSMGLAVIGFADAFADLDPELVVVLGDRYEIMSAASAAMVANIPIAHLHGGERTEGAFDESIRHSITKMSHLHFTATDEYRRRVIQLGEQPDRVFNVGAIGIDSIKKLKLLSRKEVEKTVGFKFKRHNLLVTFHPVTLEPSSARHQFDSLLCSLDDLKDTHIIFTKSNSDVGGREINEMIDCYVDNNPDKSNAHVNLGQLRYLSAMKYMSGVIGNSSSGLIEAPSLHVGTINIGDRQKGRVRGESVIDCPASHNEINNAFSTLFSSRFQKKLLDVDNPYGDGDTTNKIFNIIQDFPLEGILKKHFYDVC